MSLGEFDLIRQYFTRPTPRAVLGVGDDCAILQPRAGMQLAISCDMLVSGRHFFTDVDPESLGHKALAVNLSDLAACGAEPLAFTLALALPESDPAWLEPFARGLLALADAHGCELVGGDTTRGPLNICITVFGEVPPGKALLRSGARAGDAVWVSGTLGEAHVALRALRGECALSHDAMQAARLRLERPTPRVALGLALRGIASAAADVSDGLVGDLGHILERSGGVAAELEAEALLPLLACVPAAALDANQRLASICSGGDDYELVFTASPQHTEAVQRAAQGCGVPVHCVGRIVTGMEPRARVLDARGQEQTPTLAPFDHFQ